MVHPTRKTWPLTNGDFDLRVPPYEYLFISPSLGAWLLAHSPLVVKHSSVHAHNQSAVNSVLSLTYCMLSARIITHAYAAQFVNQEDFLCAVHAYSSIITDIHEATANKVIKALVY